MWKGEWAQSEKAMGVAHGLRTHSFGFRDPSFMGSIGEMVPSCVQRGHAESSRGQRFIETSHFGTGVFSKILRSLRKTAILSVPESFRGMTSATH